MSEKLATPISIRKLKKFYVIKTKVILYFYSVERIIVYATLEEFLRCQHNLYFNKKILKRALTLEMRYREFTGCYKKYYPDEVIIEFVPYVEGCHHRNDMTIYSVYKSKNDYLKWKLKS